MKLRLTEKPLQILNCSDYSEDSKTGGGHVGLMLKGAWIDLYAPKAVREDLQKLPRFYDESKKHGKVKIAVILRSVTNIQDKEEQRNYFPNRTLSNFDIKTLHQVRVVNTKFDNNQHNAIITLEKHTDKSEINRTGADYSSFQNIKIYDMILFTREIGTNVKERKLTEFPELFEAARH